MGRQHLHQIPLNLRNQPPGAGVAHQQQAKRCLVAPQRQQKGASVAVFSQGRRQRVWGRQRPGVVKHQEVAASDVGQQRLGIGQHTFGVRRVRVTGFTI